MQHTVEWQSSLFFITKLTAKEIVLHIRKDPVDG